MNSLAREVNSSIIFFERYNGPFPFLAWLFLKSPAPSGKAGPACFTFRRFLFFRPRLRNCVGLNSTSQEAFTDIMPVHEVAHQWWGNVVGWSSYRDQWITEGLAVYLSLLYADSQKMPNRTLLAWLGRYRKRLSTKPVDSDVAPVDIGPVIMGSRLSSSKSPDGYDVVDYSKGAWIFHMIRGMLRDSKSREPDTRFIALLHTLVTKYAQKPLSTAQLQKEVEAVMTPSMDLEGGRSMEWFFEEFVRGTGIPRYKVEFTARKRIKAIRFEASFFSPACRTLLLRPFPFTQGRLLDAASYWARFRRSARKLLSPSPLRPIPHKLLIDPHMTLFCLPE